MLIIIIIISGQRERSKGGGVTNDKGCKMLIRFFCTGGRNRWLGFSVAFRGYLLVWVQGKPYSATGNSSSVSSPLDRTALMAMRKQTIYNRRSEHVLLWWYSFDESRSHVRTHTRTHARTHTHTNARMHAHTQTHVRTHARTHTQTHARTHTHTHTYTQTRTHTHTHTHTHTYITPHCHNPRAQELCESLGGRPGLPSLISLMVSVDVKHHERRKSHHLRAQELCESRCGCPELPVANNPYGLCGRKATLNVSPPKWLCIKMGGDISHFNVSF